MTSSILARCLAGSLLSVGLAIAPTTVSADATSFSGQAYLAKATLTPPFAAPVTIGPIADTGQLPSQGGNLENSLLTVSLSNPIDSSTLLTGEVGHTSTIGQGDRSRSEASLAAINLAVAGQTVSADFLMARAMAKCGPTVSGSSELANLVVDGNSYTVGTAPNQSIPLPNNLGSIIINEQSSNVNGSFGSMDVNALHVMVTGVADVVVAHAHADMTCTGSPSCTGGDFLTGGGWINLPSGARANLAVAGGFKNGAYWGHLLYSDHGSDLKVKGTGVTGYMVVDQTTRHIEGNDEANGSPGTYDVDAADNGEPGQGIDFFHIKLSNGYEAANYLAGGNIQLHKPCQ